MRNTLKNKYFYISIFLLLVLVFMLQNNRPVQIDFFFWNITSANLLVLLTTFFVLGGVFGYFGHQIYRLRKKRSPKQTRRDAMQGSQYNPVH
ncbi:MAG: LapA family protein [Bacteriovoracaceae bacterium]|nr:LapA family protein [Bacteriovoracaceae bacterium]